MTERGWGEGRRIQILWLKGVPEANCGDSGAARHAEVRDGYSKVGGCVQRPRRARAGESEAGRGHVTPGPLGHEFGLYSRCKGSQEPRRANRATCSVLHYSSQPRRRAVGAQGGALSAPDQLTCFFQPTGRPQKALHPWGRGAQAPILHGTPSSCQKSPRAQGTSHHNLACSRDPAPARDTSRVFNKHLLNRNELGRQSLRRYSSAIDRGSQPDEDNGLKSR